MSRLTSSFGGSPKKIQGVFVRHGRRCATRSGGRCSCRPGFQAQVWSPRDHKPLRKTFPTPAQALAWRREMQVVLRRQRPGTQSVLTFERAVQEWLVLAKTEVVRTRSGYVYKPSALRSYEGALRALLPELGNLRLTAISRHDLQEIVDRLVLRGRAPSTIRNAMMPVRALYRLAEARGNVVGNPTANLKLPAVRTARQRVVTPEEAATLIGMAPACDRPIWGTAIYTGLRCGELLALDWACVDFDGGIIRVEHSWDRVVGPIDPKSRHGVRRVPMNELVRDHLTRHRVAQGHGGIGLVFGRTPAVPFNPYVVTTRARKAWTKAGVTPIGFHECRHTYAAFMIAAGVNAKSLSTYMGHANIMITLDRYGHLLPGNETEAAALLDKWLRGDESRQRV
jgi:integrase